MILPVALVLFVVVENLEHVSVGLPAPGLAVLGSYQYHSVVGVFAAISFLAALVDALYRWRRDVLVARIEAARARLQRRPTAVVALRPAVARSKPRIGHQQPDLRAGAAPLRHRLSLACAPLAPRDPLPPR